MEPKKEEATPLHIILKRFRVIYFLITFVFLWIVLDALYWYKDNHETMSEAGTAGFVSIMLAVIGALNSVLKNLDKNTEHD